ncbi:mitochondrial carrier [Ascoidea rubescens DSM 1968]|uniref:Mitochondrial carrier n=1 Tax=Ascoidea rubescens DSM 1968 TaxID=1344418 RepID=A0A1D2V944_9ASCO|nr:mitochondrial carrier [Ascoidea rubescens DSM 1968]ODV57973.1 mitochondrial carrier [Ascoidea rubescens DSM 1968]
MEEALKTILFGSIAGSLGKIIEYPFDTVKVRLQSQAGTSDQLFRSTFHCIQYTFKTEKLRGFYSGLSSPLVGAAFENAILFFSYEYCQSLFKKYYNSPDATLNIWQLVISGGFSGISASFLLTPVELIKCQMQVKLLYQTKLSSSKPLKNPSIIELIKIIILNQGIKGLWHGQLVTLIREFIGSSIWFGTYEVSNRNLKRLNPNNNSVNEFISGAAAGVGYNAITFPIDTVKSKLQTTSIVNPSLVDQNIKIDFLEIAKLIYLKNGIKGFYTGLGITLIRCIPANGVIFLTYDKLKFYYK